MVSKTPGELTKEYLCFLMQIWITGHIPSNPIISQPIKWNDKGIIAGTEVHYQSKIVVELAKWGYLDVVKSERSILITREATGIYSELIAAYMRK